MEQQETGAEDQQRPLLQQAPEVDRRLGFGRQVAVGPLRVDLAGDKTTQRQQGGHHEAGRDEEHRLSREEIAASAHHPGREAGADGGKAGVAAEPLADRPVSD
jgi:hypothetical protein